MICLRSRLFDLAFVLWTSLFAPGILILWLCGSPEAAIRSTTRLWARGVLFTLRYTVGLDYVEHGKRPPVGQPHLIVSNHQSMWETLAFLVIFPDVTVIAKQELLRIPIFSWYLKHSPMIIIDRKSGGNALKENDRTEPEGGNRRPLGSRLPRRITHAGDGTGEISRWS
jgi:1-acyl-sn-glycerol-3-phosphate acyltransferase